MYKIQQITADPSQQQILVLPDGTQINIALQYLPTQQIWNCNLTYGSTFVLNGLSIVNNPNLLQPWKHLIPFGFGCFATASREPSQLQDFLSGYASLYVLTADDLAAYGASLATRT